MAFTSYLILDGYRYKALAKQWRPQIMRPATPRVTLQGDLEATFGAVALKRWEGMLSVRHGEAAPGLADGTREGNIWTLRRTLQKTTTVAFIDHNGTYYGEAVLTGPFSEQALINVWDSTANKYYVSVQITARGEDIYA